MRLIFGLVLIIGVSLAGFAVYIAKDRFDQYQAAIASQQRAIVPVQEVFVVKRQLRYGELLTEADVRGIAWPADSVPAGAFTSMEQIFPADKPEPRTILRVMERDEPLLIAKVTAPGEDAGVSARLGSGKRAFALRVDMMSGVSGFLRPGDRVDVYWSGSSSEGQGITRLIHANLQLLAIDQVTDEDRNNPMIAQSVTVEATPEQVAKLAQAQATGRLTLALVGVSDETESPSVEADNKSVLGTAEQVSEGPQVCTIRTRKGSEVVLIPIPCTN
jgi:pilus assembly protein CpaB